MVAYSTTKNLALVANSSYVGTWDSPTNSNWGIVDAALGGVATISLNNSNVVLSATQFQQQQITFNSTLTGSVTITFPSTYTGWYSIYNTCTGSSAFTVTLATTAAGGAYICAPPGEVVDVTNDGTNLRYKNLGRVGSYMDWAGSSVPSWISGCSTPPYLNCDGTAFSSATYPNLANFLGTTTLPDSKGRTRFYLNQGSGRITSAGGYGIDGNTAYASGGSQTFAQANLPSINFTVNALFLVKQTNVGSSPNQTVAADTGSGGAYTGLIQGTAASGGSGSNFLPPGFVGGLCLIRAG